MVHLDADAWYKAAQVASRLPEFDQVTEKFADHIRNTAPVDTGHFKQSIKVTKRVYPKHPKILDRVVYSTDKEAGIIEFGGIEKIDGKPGKLHKPHFTFIKATYGHQAY